VVEHRTRRDRGHGGRRDARLSQHGSISRIRTAGGSVEKVASRIPAPDGLALDREFAYTVAARGILLRAPKAGGDPIPLGAAHGGNAAGLAADAEGVYWPVRETVVRLANGATTPTTYGVLRRDAQPRVFVADARTIYVTAPDSQGRALYALPKEGGCPVVILRSRRIDIGPIALDATHVYFASREGVMRVPKRK
jgi:hypothetical protein